MQLLCTRKKVQAKIIRGVVLQRSWCLKPRHLQWKVFSLCRKCLPDTFGCSPQPIHSSRSPLSCDVSLFLRIVRHHDLKPDGQTAAEIVHGGWSISPSSTGFRSFQVLQEGQQGLLCQSIPEVSQRHFLHIISGHSPLQ